LAGEAVAQHAHPADRFAREILAILERDTMRSRRLMRNSVGRPHVCHSWFCLWHQNTGGQYVSLVTRHCRLSPGNPTVTGRRAGSLPFRCSGRALRGEIGGILERDFVADAGAISIARR
jgi:hypothetical protein